MVPERVEAWAAQHDSPPALRKAVRDRLLGRDIAQLAFGKIDEYPDDVVVELLRSDLLDADRTKAVAAGWRDARVEVECVLEDMQSEAVPEPNNLEEAFENVFRVPERVAHLLLRPGVFGALKKALDPANFNTDQTHKHPLQLQQVVAAAFVYEPREYDEPGEYDLDLWQDALAIEDIAAYAFRALLKLRSARPKISSYLQDLILRQYRDLWDINAWTLCEFARMALNSDEAIVVALRRIRAKDSQLWNDIKNSAPSDPCWSANWVKRVELHDEPSTFSELRSERSPKVGMRTSSAPLSFPPYPNLLEAELLINETLASASMRVLDFELVHQGMKQRVIIHESSADDAETDNSIDRLLEMYKRNLELFGMTRAESDTEMSNKQEKRSA